MLHVASLSRPASRSRESEQTRERPLTLSASSQAELVGFATYAIEDRCAHVLELHVRKDRWQQGIGRQLVRELKKDVAGSGYTCMTLIAATRNTPALNLYRSEGFTPTKRQRDYVEFVCKLSCNVT